MVAAMPSPAAIDALTLRRGAILHIAARHGISNVRVFGSVARGEANPQSDLDLLVDIEEGRSLFSLIAAKQEIEELIGCKVDLVTEDGLHGPRRDSILRDATLL
jgi:uncharacterized protein